MGVGRVCFSGRREGAERIGRDGRVCEVSLIAIIQIKLPTLADCTSV